MDKAKTKRSESRRVHRSGDDPASHWKRKALMQLEQRTNIFAKDGFNEAWRCWRVLPVC